jgi:hypothetical protein
MRLYTLYDWKFETKHDGYTLYCVGELPNGRGWETSSVVSMNMMPDGYHVVTRNSEYFLPW